MNLISSLGAIGLTFDLLGAIILFIWGPPVSGLIEGGNEAVTLPANKSSFKKILFISRAGLLLLIIGFLLQLLGLLFQTGK